MAAPVEPLVGTTEYIQQMHFFHPGLHGGLEPRQPFRRRFTWQLAERWLSFFSNDQFTVLWSGAAPAAALSRVGGSKVRARRPL